MSIHPQHHIIFQSTLPRGERHICSIMFSSSGSFQSTLPRGERQFVLSILLNCCEFQSTLPRGERRKTGNTSGRFVGFQSTLPRGERHIRICISCMMMWHFNPRSREGSDYAPHQISRDTVHFNPRSREGSDSFTLYFSQRRENISIHAPARGATKAERLTESLRLFQSTLPRGERLLFDLPGNILQRISIHAPARGATLTTPSHLRYLRFQSTLPRGERLLRVLQSIP